MCAAKSPISILQEYTMMQHLPFPHYDVFQQGTGFKCIVTVGELQKTAVAESKKRAKHLCAALALAVLQPCEASGTTLISYEEPECAFHSTVCVNMTDSAFNAIGKLNELCSQNGKLFPTYAEVGCIEQKFVIRCSLLNYVTEGKGATKKQAKQNAAKEMLNRVQIPDFHANLLKAEEWEAKKRKYSHTSEMQEKVVELFKQLSATKRPDTQPQIQSDPFLLFDADTAPKSSQKIDDEFVKTPFKLGVLSESELKQELAKLNICYTISTLQVNPLILLLKTKPVNGISYTFMQKGDSYAQCVVDLLQKTFDSIRILIKYSSCQSFISCNNSLK